MLPNHLTTNEVKNAAGAEVEFLRQATEINRSITFAKSGEQFNLPYRLGAKHLETGSGLKLRRRSQVWVKVTHIAADGVTPVSTLVYTVADIPIGAISSNSVPKDAIAHQMSFLATTGAGTTVLYDCTGYGGEILLNGTL